MFNNRNNLADIIFFETTDKRKATKALHRKEGVIYGSPNIVELRSMAKFLSPHISIKETKDLNEILALSEIVSQVIDIIIVTLGDKGLVTVKNAGQPHHKSQKTLVAQYYPVKALSHVENVSGAGDCFASGYIHGMLSGYKESHNVFLGIESAKQALTCKSTVPKDLCLTNTIYEAAYIRYEIKISL